MFRFRSVLVLSTFLLCCPALQVSAQTLESANYQACVNCTKSNGSVDCVCAYGLSLDAARENAARKCAYGNPPGTPGGTCYPFSALGSENGLVPSADCCIAQPVDSCVAPVNCCIEQPVQSCVSTCAAPAVCSGVKAKCASPAAGQPRKSCLQRLLRR